MKLALLVALATVAAVSSYTPTVHSTVYRPGEQYIYHYKGQVLSGIPKSTKQFSGLLIDSIVILQFQQDNKVVMRMEKIKLFKINNKISTLPSEPIPESELTHMTGEQAQVLSEFLVKPIKFRYDEGEVREIEKETHDRYWSVNIKKGILSLFMVTLKEKSSHSSDSSLDPTMTRINSRYSNSRSTSYNTPYWKLATKSNSVYKVMETDVLGNCETKYTVIPDKTEVSPSSSKMHVTAVRNLDNCVNKPFYIQGLFQGVYVYPAEQDLIQPTVHYDYIITGDRTHFLIKEAKLHSKYLFLVNGLEGGDMSTFIYQHLTLKTTEPISTPMRLSQPKLDIHGLLMVIPQSTLIPEKKSYEETSSGRRGSYVSYRSKLQQEFGSKSENKYYENSERELREENEEEPFTGETDILPVIETKLSELIHCLYPMTDKKCSHYLLEISRLVRQLNKPLLKSLLTRYLREETSGSETEYRKAEILLDILPTLPSPDAAKVLVELIRDRQITEVRGTVLIKAMSLLVKPTPSLIKSVLELFKELPKERSSTISSKTMLRQSLLLSVGTLTHRLITVMRSHSKPLPEIISFLDDISSELKRMLEETQSESEKILILKSLGNMGASQSIVTLKHHAEDTRQPIRVRITSLLALRRLAKPFNKQVVPILLGVYMDVKEVKEMRMASFLVLIQSNPSYTTLQMIAHRLRHEPHAQIRTLVYSSLINLASYMSHEPEHKELAKNARLIIKTIPPVHVGLQDSMEVLINKFSEKLDLGGSLNILKLKSKMSGMPDVLAANLRATLFGKHRRLLEVGAVGRSLEVLLRKIFGPHGLIKEIMKGHVSVRDILKPLTRPEMGGVEHKIREILNKMMFELRSEGEPFGTWYIQLLDNELQYITLNSENVEEVINKVTNFIPELIMKLTRGIKVDIIKSISNIASLTVSSPIGIPLTLNYTTMGIFKVDGHIKVNNLPSWPEMINKFSSLSVPKLSLEVDVKPFLDVTNSIMMGADLRWLATGVGADVNVRVMKPVKFSVNIDVPKNSLSVKLFTPQETIKALHFKAMPFTYIKYFPTTVNKLPFHIEVNEIKGEHIVKVAPFEHKYLCSISGTEVETRGTYSLCGPNWCPITPLFGKQELNVVLRTDTTVDFVILKIKSLRSNFELEGVPASHVTDSLYENDSDEEDEDQTMYKERNYRTSSRSMIESGEFEPITVDPIFQSEPIKRQLLITLGPNTQQSPKVKSLVTWLMGRKYWKNQFNVQVVRLSHGQTPSWKIHLNNVVNPLVWYPEETFKGETEFLNKMTLLWNIEGEMKELKVKIIPGSPFDFTRELKEHAIWTVDNLPEAKSQKYKYTIMVDTPHMTPKMLKYITIVHDLIKFQFYSKLTTSIPHTPLNNKIIVAVELLPWWEKMNVIVKTPRENSYISSVPFYWNPFLPTHKKTSFHDVPAWKWYKNTTDEEYFVDSVPYRPTPFTRSVLGECVITPRKVDTFDNVVFPLDTVSKHFERRACHLVLAQHCTNEALFSVIGSTKGDAIMTKVLVPKFEFEVVQKYGSELTVLVNGEEKTLRISEPITIGDDYSESSRKLYTIVKLDSGIIEIKAHELGLTLKFDGPSKTTNIKLSPWSMLQGQLCGLCGNFNQDQSDDYDTPTDFQTENRDFPGIIRNSFIGSDSSDSCSYNELKKSSSEYCTKESHHITIRRWDNEVPMTCTSESRVPRCAEGCRPEKTESIKTCFTCRTEEGQTQPRKSYIPPRWDTDASGVDCEDFFQRVEVPTRCVPVY